MSYLPFQAISYIPSMIFTEGFKGQEVIKLLLYKRFGQLYLFIPIA